MSVSSEVVQQINVADGSTTEFAIPFSFIPGTIRDCLVVEVMDLNGVVVEKLESTDFEIESGLTPTKITFLTAPTDQYKVILRRDYARRQVYSYIDDGPFAADQHEKALDRIVLYVQELWNRVSRSVRLSDWILPSAFDPILPDAVIEAGSAGKALVINATNDGLDLGPTTTDIASAAAAAAAVSAAATSLNGWLVGIGPFAIVEGQTDGNLGGATEALFDPADFSTILFTAEITRGTKKFIQRFHMKNDGSIYNTEEDNFGEVVPSGVEILSTINGDGKVKMQATVDADGLGDGTIKLKWVAYAAD